jgi:hypothetical protein
MKLPEGHITADELPDMICRVCHTTLDVGVTYYDDTMVDFSFNHPPAYVALDLPEHEPEPVMATASTERVGICDFCSEPGPFWTYMATNFDVEFAQMNTISTSIGAWAACGQCHRLIEADKYRELCERALRIQVHKIEKGTPSAALKFQLRKYIKGLHQRFKENRVGPAIEEF